MNITIYGSGYVGLVTAACLAQAGNHVLCVDVDEKRIEQLKQGIIPIHEPGLQELVQSSLKNGHIEFTTIAEKGTEHGLLQFIAVGTPPDEDGSADLRNVMAVANSIGQSINEYRVVVCKSTVPVGTASNVSEVIRQQLKRRNLQIGFDVVSNPEFLKEGSAIEDFMKPDRIIVGTESSQAAELLCELYKPFGDDLVQVMDTASSELTKYAANAMLATRISFMNELANIAEHLGADIEHVRRGIGADPRIGSRFIRPGCGYGGSCFPKDVKALQSMARQVNTTAHLLEAVDKVNHHQKQVLFEKIRTFFNDELQDKVIALWGLAFKPGTDDVREAPSRTLLEALWSSGAKVQAYDPVAMDQCKRIYGDHPQLQLCERPEQTLHLADALAIITEWEEFINPDFEQIRQALAHPVIFDGRNLYDPEKMQQIGFKYYAIGRGDSLHQ